MRRRRRGGGGGRGGWVGVGIPSVGSKIQRTHSMFSNVSIPYSRVARFDETELNDCAVRVFVSFELLLSCVKITQIYEGNWGRSNIF